MRRGAAGKRASRCLQTRKRASEQAGKRPAALWTTDISAAGVRLAARGLGSAQAATRRVSRQAAISRTHFSRAAARCRSFTWP